ncbi:MAG: hypothetical protein LBK95_17950 [Bifidobacteriaceae bacterium]|jgi:hypothetical protein|nr:hypothetical protein [Bifidobacteriaceae bacterium]
MTDANKGAASEGYELSVPLDVTSWAAREDLVDILTRELLGPDGGDHEVLDVQPDARYIIGLIAPAKLRHSYDVPEPKGGGGDSTFDLGDDQGALASTGVPLSDVGDAGPDGDEDTGGDRDDEPVRRGLMIPASMGLRLQIPSSLEASTVRASWGMYNPERTGETSPSGRE